MIYNVNGKDVNVTAIIRRRNTYGIKIIDNDNIEVYSPYKLKDDEILKLLEKHKRFISKRISANEVKADEIHILGKLYKIKVIEADFYNILVDDYLSEVRIYTKYYDDKAISIIINEYYKQVLMDIVNKNIDRIKKEMNIDYDITFQYKRVSTYFGECFHKKKLVILNTSMAKYELKYILSVIYHELAHFYFHNHQDKFYDYLDKIYPNYKKTQRELRKIRYYEKY